MMSVRELKTGSPDEYETCWSPSKKCWVIPVKISFLSGYFAFGLWKSYNSSDHPSVQRSATISSENGRP